MLLLPPCLISCHIFVHYFWNCSHFSVINSPPRLVANLCYSLEYFLVVIISTCSLVLLSHGWRTQEKGWIVDVSLGQTTSYRLNHTSFKLIIKFTATTQYCITPCPPHPNKKYESQLQYIHNHRQKTVIFSCGPFTNEIEVWAISKGIISKFVYLFKRMEWKRSSTGFFYLSLKIQQAFRFERK